MMLILVEVKFALLIFYFFENKGVIIYDAYFS